MVRYGDTASELEDVLGISPVSFAVIEDPLPSPAKLEFTVAAVDGNAAGVVIAETTVLLSSWLEDNVTAGDPAAFDNDTVVTTTSTEGVLEFTIPSKDLLITDDTETVSFIAPETDLAIVFVKTTVMDTEWADKPSTTDRVVYVDMLLVLLEE